MKENLIREYPLKLFIPHCSVCVFFVYLLFICVGEYFIEWKEQIF